ncbi:38ff0132-0df5-4b85-b511-f80f7cd2f5e1 [Sclerotinia trifoliorum]|uniref:38ff0132-0df5-4b85-b511-f80f7cd2f5e1 n=1 Tax=Sclerotinia trifoliorum TaxID=28548 RepID=A0A8H2ZP29_9HELO|nr:38ff0132-0df5-4b85-b511-f80f7cd2f5e1 [Sclerotinia trifoliorum]
MDENSEHGQEPTERERSAAEMEALHQAMMEELGIGRRDALPLEDRTANVSVVPLALTSKRVRPENPASVWHNFHPDDVEPGLEELDDIAGGQLYRLRRGGTGLSSGGRGGHSAGRGRGGGSNRGGHASAGGRGNFAGKGRDVDPSRSRQTHCNDARRGGKSRATIDAGIARLQREAEFSRMNRTEGRSVKMPPLTPKPTMPVSRAAAPAASRHTTSKFKLQSPATFLSHNKIVSSPTTRTVNPVATPPQNNIEILVPSPTSNLAPHGNLATSRWAETPVTLVDTSEPKHADQPATPISPTSTSVSVHSTQLVTAINGMRTSTSDCSGRAATSYTPTNVPESNHAVQSAINAAPLTLVTNGLERNNATPFAICTIVDERNVKICKNNGVAKLGTARLVKSHERSPLTLELQIGGEVILSELLTETTILKADANIVTYRAKSTTENVPTWKFHFQLPGPAKGFVNYHIFKIAELRRSGCSSQSSEKGKQSPLVPLSPVLSSSVSLSSNTTSHNDVTYYANRISSGTFADLNELNGQETLLSLHEEEAKPEDNQAGEYSNFQDLLSLMEGDIVEGTLQVLNSNHGGSFIDHVSQLAKGTELENDAEFMKHAKNVFIGGLSSSRYSNSKPILSVTEELVADFLKKSETLLRFPQEFIETYIKEISKKILDKAQNPQNVTQSAAVGSTESSSPAEAARSAEVCEVASAVKPLQSVQAVEAGRSTEAIKSVEYQPTTAIKSNETFAIVPKPERITYSIEEMMKMRPNATFTRQVIAARDSLEKYLPGYKRQIAPTEIIRVNESGVRIVAGKTQGPRYKDSQRATATKLQPSEWKTQYASIPSKKEVSQVIQKDKTIEQKQTSNQTSFEPTPGYTGIQDYPDTGNGTSFYKLSPAEWTASFNSTSSKDTSSQANKVKKIPSATGIENENIENSVHESIPAGSNFKKPSDNTCHQNIPGKTSAATSINSQAASHNVPKYLTTAEESEAEVKVESEDDTSPLVLPSNRGLSTSRYATPEICSQEAVIRASSGYKHPPCRVGKGQDSSQESGDSSTPLRSTQVHDSLLWESLLSTKQRQISIKVESPEAFTNETKYGAFTPGPENPMPVTFCHTYVLNANRTVPQAQAVFEIETTSSAKAVVESEVVEKTEAHHAAVATAAWATFDRSGSQTTKTVKSCEIYPSVLEATGNEITVPKVKYQDQPRSKHTATDSDVDRLAQVLSVLDVKTEKDNGLVSTVLEVPERSSSPTVEELLQKKRSNGLATSRWASTQAPVFKPLPTTPKPTAADYGQLNSNMLQNSGLNSPHYSNYNPFIQAQSSNENFSQYGNQYSTHQGQTSHEFFSLEGSQPPALFSTVLLGDPNTAKVTEITGYTLRTHNPVPVTAHIPPVNAGTPPGSFPFPPRPGMFDKSFPDTDSEDVLKANAPVFIPSHQRGGSAMTRPALSPVRNRQNSHQEAVQTRLNKS